MVGLTLLIEVLGSDLLHALVVDIHHLVIGLVVLHAPAVSRVPFIFLFGHVRQVRILLITVVKVPVRFVVAVLLGAHCLLLESAEDIVFAAVVLVPTVAISELVFETAGLVPAVSFAWQVVVLRLRTNDAALAIGVDEVSPAVIRVLVFFELRVDIFWAFGLPELGELHRVRDRTVH